MTIKKELFLSTINERSQNDGTKYYVVSFLDENDDKYQLFYSEEDVKPLMNLKHLDKVTVTLSIVKSDKGKYNIYRGK